jgi:hypothetical protein
MRFRKVMALLALILAVFAFGQAASAQQAPPGPAPILIQPTEPEAEGIGYGKTKADFESWRQYFQEGETTCWGCTLFSKTAEVTAEMGAKGNEAFAASASSAIAAFMGLWIMWQLYLMLSITHANSPAQSIDTIFNRIVIMFLVMFVLNVGAFNYIMTPFLQTLGGTMQAAQTLLPGGGANYGTCSGMAASGAGAYVAQGNQLLCSMQKELGGGVALGTWMMASSEFSLFTQTFDVQQLVMGMIIFAVFLFMIIILPFRFFDALVRIATVSAILPLVVLAYLFKPSRGMVKQAITSLLTAMLTFLFTAIAMAIAISVLHAVTADIYNRVDPASGNGDAFGGINGSDFMVLLTATLGMASMLQSAGNLAAEFAGFQGQMGNAGAAGAGAVTGSMNLATKAAGGYAGMQIASNRVGQSVAGAIGAGKAG